MSTTKGDVKKILEQKAYNMRANALRMTTQAGSGHPTSALSAADLVAALFFYGMGYDPHNPHNPENDRFILSKGHASPILYAAWKEVGILSDKDLQGYREFDSVLEGHPTMRFEHTEAATGSLGIGLSIGAGMALYAKMFKKKYRTFVLLGDSEITEGSVWEAAEVAAFYKLDNLVALLDCNRLGQSTETIHGYHLNRYAAKFEAFGWKTIKVDGHDMMQIMHALDKAQEADDHPTIILAKTVKGYGVEEAENKEGFHGKAFKKEELPAILKRLKERFADVEAEKLSKDILFEEGRYGAWQKQFGKQEYRNMTSIPDDIINNEKTEEQESNGCLITELKDPHYELGEMMPTRKAYGQALTDLGRVCDRVVSLDAEVKNSTFAELFEEKFPDRFVQCFIAEQNMISMGVGFELRGAVPFISTFASFFSRAFDQIRMAAIGQSNIRLVGSHAGVSIGQDGPSQMGLEDIALMRSLPGSIVLYPCDAVSTHRLVGQMAEYNQGISYLRTTRMATPVMYDLSQDFFIGGCHVLKKSDQDKVCVIGAGVTLFEALKAHDMLKKDGISISVIDLYSIKPIDAKTILECARASGNRIITVEDHYLEGGLGQAVAYEVRNTDINITCLAVTKLPRSGTPEELLAFEGIDADAIVKAVKSV